MDLTSEILRLARPSTVLGTTDVAWTIRLCQTLRAFLVDQRAQWLQRRKHVPVLECYSSDSTPLTTRDMHKACAGAFAATRFAASTKSWLVHRLFLLDSHGDSAVVFEQPKWLTDKTAMCHLSAQMALTDMARQSPRDAITISHHVFDRALKESCGRLQMQRHRAFDEFEEAEHGPEHARLSSLRSWCVTVGCSAHDVHNAFRWSIMAFVGDPAVMRKCWVVLQSLRSSFGLLTAALPDWLALRIEFDDAPDPEALFDFWVMLGQTHEWARELAILHLRWEGGRLKVGRQCVVRENAPQAITACLLHLWHFRGWSESRWCAIGESARRIIGAVFLGLQDLCAFIIDSPKYSNYHISGCTHLDDTMLNACAIIAASSRVSEHCLLTVLDDDRLAYSVGEVNRVSQLEIATALELPDVVLHCLASCCRLSVTALRGDIARAVAVQGGYMRHRFREAERLPWSLVGGDVAGKVKALAAAEKPLDDTARKIWELARLGYPMTELVDAINLMGQASWSTVCVEQGHSAGAALVRKHPHYSSSTVAARSMIAQCRVLFNSCPTERGISLLKRKIQRLRRKRPDLIQGRQVFCGSMCRRVRRQERLGKVLRPGAYQWIFKHHNRVWGRTGKVERRPYEDLARVLREERAEQVQVDLASAQARLRSLRSERAALASTEGPVKMSRCRLTEAQKADICAMLEGSQWTRKRTQELHEEACKPVVQPGEVVQMTLGLMGPPPAEPKARVPDFLPWLAHNREFFRNCVLKQVREDSVAFYAIIYASQNPVSVCFSPLVSVEVPEPFFSAQTFQEQWVDCWDNVFDWSPGQFAFSDEGVLDPDAQFFVLTDVVYKHPRQLCADGSFVPLGEVRKWLPGRDAKPAKPRGPAPVVGDPEALPWRSDPAAWMLLRDEPSLAAARDSAQEKLGADADADVSDEAAGSESESEDDEVSLAELWDRRAELAALADGGDDSFSWCLRGGRWLKKERGVEFDSYRAFARGGEPQDWCSAIGLPRSATFSINKYGEDFCVQLCQLWVAKMSFLKDVWEARQAAGPAAPAARQEFKPATSLASLATDGVPAVVSSRARGIMKLRLRA